MRMTLEQAIDAGLVFPASHLAEQAGPDGAAQLTGGVAFSLPVEIVSEMNRREHWAARYRRAKLWKRIAYYGTRKNAASLCDRIRAGDGMRLIVLLVRLLGARQRPFDGDNLQAGFKAVRDGIAIALGIDDGSPRISWCYGQEPGPDRKSGARVVITEVQS